MVDIEKDAIATSTYEDDMASLRKSENMTGMPRNTSDASQTRLYLLGTWWVEYIASEAGLSAEPSQHLSTRKVESLLAYLVSIRTLIRARSWRSYCRAIPPMSWRVVPCARRSPCSVVTWVTTCY